MLLIYFLVRAFGRSSLYHAYLQRAATGLSRLPCRVMTRRVIRLLHSRFGTSPGPPGALQPQQHGRSVRWAVRRTAHHGQYARCLWLMARRDVLG